MYNYYKPCTMLYVCTSSGRFDISAQPNSYITTRVRRCLVGRAGRGQGVHSPRARHRSPATFAGRHRSRPGPDHYTVREKRSQLQRRSDSPRLGLSRCAVDIRNNPRGSEMHKAIV